MKSMSNISSGFSDICALLDDTPNALQRILPLAKIVAKVILICSGDVLSGSTDLFGALDKASNISSIIDLFDEAFVAIDNWPWKKKTIPTYATVQLANSLLVFAAYFDTIKEEHPYLWEALNLSNDEVDWISNKTISDNGQLFTFPEGEHILHINTQTKNELINFYKILNSRLKAFSSGLAKTEHIIANWDHYPDAAFHTYHNNIMILHARYPIYQNWADRSLLESMADDIKSLHRKVDTLAPNDTDQSSAGIEIHLPLLTALMDNDFTGRESEIESLFNAYHSGQRLAILNGVGGIGKTELAIHFGHEYERQGYGRAYFATFIRDFRHTVIHSIYAGISPIKSDHPSDDQIYAYTIGELRRCNPTDLLILDNADSLDESFDQLKRSLSELNMRVLITTRTDIPGALFVDRLNQDNLHTIFRKYKVTATPKEIDALVDAVDGHTLTIDLIARTISRGHRTTAQQILDSLYSYTLPHAQFRKIASSYQASDKQMRIYEHLCAVFKTAELSESECNVMRCAILLPQIGLDEQTFSNALPDDYLDSLDQLIDRGWLTIKANKIMIHPVIQIVCREELKATDEICTPFLQNISQQRDKYEYNTTCITEMAELYSNACRDLSTGTGDWQLCAAAFWKKLAKFEIALSYELQTISILETLPTYLPMDLFVAYNNIGNTYNKLGSTDLALRYYLKAIDIWNNNIRAADMLVAICYDNVGVLYTEQNNPEKGLKYSTHALQIMEAVCSTTSPEIANCHNSIGSAFHDLKQYEQAIYHKLRALDIRQKLLPENHPDIGLSYENVGTTYDALGEHSMALHYDLKAVQILEKSLPDGHPELAFCCANLGAVYCNLNDNENALIYLLKAVKMLHTTLPASHQSFIAVYLNISTAYYQSGNFKESLNYAQLAYTIAIKSLSEDHPTRKLITHVLADLELQNTTLSKESPQ